MKNLTQENKCSVSDQESVQNALEVFLLETANTSQPENNVKMVILASDYEHAHMGDCDW